MDKTTFDRIVVLLVPYVADEANRHALVESALYGCVGLNQIDWSGAAQPFAVRLIQTLDRFGQCANESVVVLLLRELRTQVGTDKQTEIDALIAALNAHSGVTPMIDEAAAIGFLIEIGRWAKSELSERWTVRRKQQHADLTNQEQAKTELPKLIQDATAGNSAIEAERTWALIQRKRDAVYRARNAKLADGEERGRQELTQAAYEERTHRHDAEIKRLLNEIEGDLESLGFTVERAASK